MEHNADTATQTSLVEVDPWSDGLALPPVLQLLRVPAQAPAMAAAVPANRFLCKDCERSFSSHQALGGHCAAHKKRFRGSCEPTGNGRRPVTVKRKERPVQHVCNVCGISYPTGQALGGHKRLHYQGVVKRIREVPNLMNQNAQEAPNIGSSGSASNTGIHMGIPAWLDAANGRVSNGHGGPEPVKGDRSKPLPRAHGPIPYPGSNHVGSEGSFGSISNIGLDRSKSGSEETKADVFDEMREHGSNYESRRKSVQIEKDGHMIRFIEGPNHENDGESSGSGLHEYGCIQSIVGSDNRNVETSYGVFLCANSGDGDTHLILNGSNKGKRKQAFIGSGLGSHWSNDADTELRLWFGARI